ncbi:MAG: TonB-dependent receptor [Cyclobacteriaceae bacterium]|nr:TonB-dependent receptor [Cyclobacteriaceae bacterium]
MNRLLLAVLLILFTSFAFAQTGEVKGVIVDAETSEPLIGATVLIKGTTIGSITDLEGAYIIKNVPAGEQTVLITYVGYEEVSVPITMIENQVVEMGSTQLKSSSVNLKELEVFASVIDDRKTPVAVSAISAKDIEERYAAADVADIIQSTPGIYTTEGAGGYGDQEVYIRGFDQSNVAFLVNGVPINDMESGYMYWSNFAGLSEVTRQIQVQRGLGASKLAISSLGGTVNMITKPADRGEGGRIEYQTGTGSWNQRLRFTYNTGVTSNGWAVSFQGSRTTTNSNFLGMSSYGQGSVVPGAFTDAWSYYLSVSKEINEQHSIMFWGFGAPVNRGTAWIVDNETRKQFNITDPMANNALGIYQGELYNARQNKIHKPLMAVTHFWDIDYNTSLSTSFYASFAKVYSTQPRDGNSSLFFPTRTKGDPEFTTGNLINWDYLAEQNRTSGRYTTIAYPNGDLNTSEISGYESQYFLEARYNNHQWLGLVSNFRKTFDRLNILGGLDMRYYKGLHYSTIYDLFGGDFKINQSNYGDDYNKLIPFSVLREGDRYGYDYDGIVKWGALFGQAEYSFNKFTAFGTGTLTLTDYKRIGNFWNGRIAYNDYSFGESESRIFTTYTLKAGVSYRPTNRHLFFVNGGRFTRPPFFRDAFVDARYTNEYRPELKNETINSFEAGYGYNTSKLRINANYYLTYWYNRTTTYDADNGDTDLNGLSLSLDNGDIIPIVVNGLISRHEGVELEFKYNVTPALELNGFLSLGDWKWANNVTVETIFESNGEVDTFRLPVNVKGFPVGASAQTTGGIGVHYSGLRNAYIGGRWNYFDRISVRYYPEDVIYNYITLDEINNKFDDYSTLQLYAGVYFDLGDNIRGRLSASVQNVFNIEYVRWSSFFFQEFQNAYGYPRTFTLGLSIDF